ncbi:hypothetical protein PR003_g29060, partial [Phytophthora rubi]
SSDVSTGIPVKILLVELAPALGCFVSSETPSRVTSEARLVLLAGSASEVLYSPVTAIFQVFSDRRRCTRWSSRASPSTACSAVAGSDYCVSCVLCSLLVITIWGVRWVPIGGSSISFFTKQGVLRDAVQCLRVWEGREVDSFPTTATLSEIEEEWVRQECFRFDKLR